MGCILKFKATNKVSYCASTDHALVSVLYDILISLSLIITSKWNRPNGGAVTLRWCRNGHRKKASEGVVEIEMQNTGLVSCISKSLLHHTGHSWKTKRTHTKPHKKPGAVTVMHCFNWTQELGLYYAFVLCFIMKFQVHDVGCGDVKSVIFVFNLLSCFYQCK